MTIYVYRCPSCGRNLERNFPMGEAPDELRSHCDDTAQFVMARRIFTAPAVRVL